MTFGVDRAIDIIVKLYVHADSRTNMIDPFFKDTAAATCGSSHKFKSVVMYGETVDINDYA